jgi:hypothetical protein
MAQVAPVPPSPPSLVAVSTSERNANNFAVSSYDFGEANPFSGKPIDHAFTLRNDSAFSWKLDHLQSSCGCTTAIVGGKAGGDVKGVVVPAKGTVEIQVSVDPTHLSPGAVEKVVGVYVQGQAEPVATLVMAGTLQAGVAFRPATVDFGNVTAGNEAKQTLTVTVDPMFPHPEKAPRLLCSDSNIQISEGTPAGGEGQTHRYTYTLSISSRPYVGQINGALSVVRPDVTDSVQTLNVSVPVVGRVLGDLSSSPETVAFGMVTLGKTAPRKVTLTGSTAESMAGLKVSSASQDVATKIVGVKDNTAVLVVSLKPSLKAGALQTQVIVTTPSGQQLLLPVYVYAVAPAK